MDMFQETNPEIYQKFNDNKDFAMKKTQNWFFKDKLGQRHKKLNKDVKGISKLFKFSFFNINGQVSKLFFRWLILLTADGKQAYTTNMSE